MSGGDGVPAATEAPLAYGKYLRIGELLALQQPLSRPRAHDELLFITVHQAYELWFKQILFELDSAREMLDLGRLGDALRALERVASIERLLVVQVDVIESMRFQDFLEFRNLLKPASGFQSVQFREIEALSGRKDERHLEVAETEAERERLRRRLDQPSVWDAFRGAMTRDGLAMPADDDERRRRSLLDLLAREARDDPLQLLSEALMEHDQLIASWRWRHVLMVERQIGAKPGTGGSSGASYLRGTLGVRFYPELWEVRGDYAGATASGK